MKKRTILQIGLVFIFASLWTAQNHRVFGRSSADQSSGKARKSTFDKTDIASRIKAVENGLLPPVIIKGHAPPAMKLRDRMTHYKVPGVSIAVINHGRIEWARGYGLADVAGNRPVTPDTRFQAASISKTVAAAAALHFVQTGRINLDRNINDYLKSWKVPGNKFTAQQKVTLRRILSHSAGFNVHGFPGYAVGRPLPTLVDILNGSKPANTPAIRVVYLPGSKYEYSGGGYTVMQQMLIDVAGKPFPAIMQQTVLREFGMKESAYSQPLRPAWRPDAATGYRSDDKPVKGLYHTYPELAAAGLWTTPSDLAREAIGIQRALAGKSNPVISQKMVALMLTRQIDDDGLGFFLNGSGRGLRFGHGGANEGFRCQLVAYARTGQGAVVMTNSDAGGQLINEILFSIAREYNWPDYAPSEHTLATVNPAVFKDYVGRYQLRPDSIITISTKDNHLFVRAGQQPAAELFPESATTYFTTSVDVELEFERNAAGKVDSLEIIQGGHKTKAKRIKEASKDNGK